VTFQEIATAETFTAVANHFKSKGSVFDAANADIGDGQANNNPLRTRAAEALDAWLATDPTGAGDADVLIMGDLNAYAAEDPITTLETAGFTDLAEAFPNPGYSFVFDGFTGTLDYAMANAGMLSQVTGAAEVPINADEVDAFDYNLDFGRNPDWYTDAPYRASDHDPIVVGIDLAPNEVAGSRGRFFATDEFDWIEPGAGRANRVYMTDDDLLDYVVIGDETQNGARDRLTVFDWEIGHDTLFLRDGVDIADISLARNGALQVRFAGDNDLMVIRGDDLSVSHLLVEFENAPIA